MIGQSLISPNQSLSFEYNGNFWLLPLGSYAHLKRALLLLETSPWLKNPDFDIFLIDSVIIMLICAVAVDDKN